MIARIWHGRTPAKKAEAYARILEGKGTQDYRLTDGNRGVFILRSDEKEATDFLLLTLWDSMDAVRRFAGPEAEKALYYPWDSDYLLEFEPLVKHYEVLG